MALVTLPRQYIADINGEPRVGARMYVYDAGTNNLRTVYTSKAYTIALSQPIRSLEGGIFPTVHINPEGGDHKIVIQDEDGATIYTEDNLSVWIDTLTSPAISAALDSLKRTSAEIAAGVTPGNFAYLAGYQLRYSAWVDAIKQAVSGGAPAFSANGGILIEGYLGSSGSSDFPVERPEAQLILRNTASSGHAIMSIVNKVATEESAIEAVGYLSNGSIQQHGAQFWRWVDSDNGATTFESVWANHLTQYQADNTPLILWGRNSVLLCGGDTSTEKWHAPIPANWCDVYTNLMARTLAVFGDHQYGRASASFALEVSGYAQFGDVDVNKATDHAVQLGYDTGNSRSFIQGYRNSTTALDTLAVLGSAIKLGGASGTHTTPLLDNNMNLGSGSLRFKEVFAAAGAINTSDEREKQDIEPIPPEWLAAWGDVQFQRYRWKAAVTEKGAGARWHVGLIAQRVKSAFESRGLDAFAIGLLCHDEWDGGDRYAIRYDEALAMECAYLRSRIQI